MLEVWLLVYAATACHRLDTIAALQSLLSDGAANTLAGTKDQYVGHEFLSTPNIVIPRGAVFPRLIAICRCIARTVECDSGDKEPERDQQMSDHQLPIPDPGASKSTEYGRPHHAEKRHDLEALRGRVSSDP